MLGLEKEENIEKTKGREKRKGRKRRKGRKDGRTRGAAGPRPRRGTFSSRASPGLLSGDQRGPQGTTGDHREYSNVASGREAQSSGVLARLRSFFSPTTIFCFFVLPSSFSSFSSSSSSPKKEKRNRKRRIRKRERIINNLHRVSIKIRSNSRHDRFSPTLRSRANRLGRRSRAKIIMMKDHRNDVFLVLLSFVLQVPNGAHVNGHGRLMDPPGRNSMWRFGFPNPVNYNDNELFCGGYAVQWVQNQGQCGVCGDAYHLNQPRPHEAGGEYARGTIVRHYTAGQVIDVEVELTANHYGRFEMYLCPNNNPSTEATQDCFDRHPLYLAGTQDVRFEIPVDTEKKAIFRYKVKLPPYVTCSQCVIQWTYYTGNMWGTCENGTEAVGCGRPETFRNCADVSIVTSTSGVPPLYVQQNNPFLLYYRDFRTPNNVFPLVVRSQVCVPTNLYQNIPGMDDWCQANCLHYPPNCPSTVCYCPEMCDAIGEIAHKEGARAYCLDKCLVHPPHCPSHRCRCY